MKIEDMISRIDRLNPNDIDDSEKREWIANLELMLLHEVLQTHVLNGDEQRKADSMTEEGIKADGYELLVKPPYDDIYRHYVDVQIAELNVDTEAYNNKVPMYNNALLTYKNWFNRTHTPKAAVKHRF